MKPYSRGLFSYPRQAGSRRRWRVLYACLLLPALHCNLPAVAAGDPARGKELSGTCVACHGTDGNSSNPIWPKLAGQHADYIIKQLQDMKAGRLQNPQMAGLVAQLDEQDMADLAAWYASQTISRGQAKPEMVALGERLFRAGDSANGIPACMSCHNPSGSGNPYANYPALAGQHAEYTALQLKNFKQEIRHNDENAVMRHIAARMTNAQIEAVSEYLQGLHWP